MTASSNPARRPTLADVQAVIGGEDVLLDTVRRSIHDNHDAVVHSEDLFEIVSKVWDRLAGTDAHDGKAST